jgi:hypothetical protein
MTVFFGQQSLAQFKFSNLFGSREKPRKNRIFEPSSSVSLGFGSSSYYGDLSPYGRIIQSSVNGIRWNAAFNFTRQISPTVGIRFGLTWARISGDDSYMNGVAGYEANFMRNLHFRNDVKELSVVAQYDLVRTERSYLRREKIIPYIFGGLAVFAHDPMALTDSLNGSINGIVYTPKWVRLQPLNTEGQGIAGSGSNSAPYSLISLAIPLGAGIRYKINGNWDFGFEVGFRYTFTDYLDDAGGNYADPAVLGSQNPLSQVMANRTLERYSAYRGIDRQQGVLDYLASKGLSVPSGNPFTLSSVPGFEGTSDQRGSSKYNDSYLLTTVKLIYHIAPKIKCPGTR